MEGENIKNSKGILEDILSKEEFSIEKPDIEKAVSAFETFSKCLFECELDEMLWETGAFNFTGELLYYFSLVRQFQLDGEDELWQLHLDLMYKFIPRGLGTRNCYWDSEDERNFFDVIRDSKIYRGLLEKECTCNIYFEET